MGTVQTEYKSRHDPVPTDKSICIVVDCGQSSNFEDIKEEIVTTVRGVVSRHGGCRLSLSEIIETKKLNIFVQVR